MKQSSSHSAPSVVALEPVKGDVRGAIRRALEAVEWKQAIPAGAEVSLKVNLGWDLFIPGSVTSPLFAEALIREIQDHVGKIYMVEADQVLEDVERAYHATGMARVCARTGVEWVNMTRSRSAMLSMPDNVVLREIEIAEILQRTVLITVPVMKTHAKTVISGAIKNQWGCLPTMRHEHHLVLDDALADLCTAVHPALAVMDATVALEGNGPKSGSSRVVDRVLCSTDPVALDTIQAIRMGIDPASVVHLARCAERGLGTNDRKRIEVRGLDPESDAEVFEPARHNSVSALENLLRKSFFKRLFFDTPIFKACLIGAKVYYRAWTALHARAQWRPILSHPLYGAQWRESWAGLEGKGPATPLAEGASRS
ncbi:MAG: DUF362 domain-containing protein [Deltaproteobacteria bacterium]|nr:DUF362 domain-containing protein [Deltaproteobacteria bacterium]